MPDLKALMPLARSPIRPEILPLPPNRTTTTATRMRICQKLSVPMANLDSRSSFHAGFDGLDAFGKIAQRARDHAPAAEENDDHGDKYENMPKTQCIQCTHREPRSDAQLLGS